MEKAGEEQGEKNWLRKFWKFRQKNIMPFIDFIVSSNTSYFGYDLFQLPSSKILNYNTYNKGEEYTWHIDAAFKSTIRDIKLTCLLNCSEENYTGGDLSLFRDGEVKIDKFEPEQIFGVAKDMSHNYRLLLIPHR